MFCNNENGRNRFNKKDNLKIIDKNLKYVLYNL